MAHSQSSITRYFKRKQSPLDDGETSDCSETRARRTEEDTETSTSSVNFAETSTGGKLTDESELSKSKDELARKKKQKLATSFSTDWAKNRPWLKYVQNQGMFCIYCQKHDKQPFGRTTWNKTPCVRIRMNSVSDHENTVAHKDAVRLEIAASLSKNIAQELTKPTDISQDGMVQAFKCLYFLAKNNIAHTTNFPKLLDLEKHLGVDISAKINAGQNAKYTSHAAVKEMLECISEVIENDILDNIRKSEGYSIMFDETTDVSVIEQLVIHSRYIDQNGDVQVKFLKILDALAKDDDTDTNVDNDGTDMNELDIGIISLNADTIRRKVTNYIEDNDLPYSTLRGIGTDGAAVMTGKRNGAVKQIIERQKDKQVDTKDPNKLISQAVGAHCAAHKLSLAAKQAGNEFLVIQKFKRVLSSLHAFYSKSAVREKGRSVIQELLYETLEESGKLNNPSETRWLCLGECAIKLKDTFISIVVSLERESEERADTTAAGLAKLMTKIEFVGILVLLCEVLPTINRLSLTFQESKVDFSAVKTALSATIERLNDVKDTSDLTSSITDVYESCKAQGIALQYSGSDVTEAIREFCKTIQKPFIEKLIENIESRFVDTDVMAAFSYIFDYRDNYIIPNLDQLVKNVSKLCHQFGIPNATAVAEIKDLIYYMKSDSDYLAKLSSTKCGSTVQSTTFPSLCKLARIYKVIPPHTADCERDFSRVKLIKTDIRNRMGEDTLDCLLRISVEGPPLEEYPFVKAVRIWANKKERRYKVRLC